MTPPATPLIVSRAKVTVPPAAEPVRVTVAAPPPPSKVSTAVADPATSLRAAPPISVSPPTALPIRTEMFCART